MIISLDLLLAYIYIYIYISILFRQTSHFCDGSGENVTFEHPFLQVHQFFIHLK